MNYDGNNLKRGCVVVECSYAGPLFTETEEKLFRLGLDRAAQPGEVHNSAVKLFESLRRRSVKAEDIIAASGATTRSGELTAFEKAKRRKMPFGRNVGRELGCLPASYLKWVLYKSDYASFELKEQIRIVLAAAEQ